MIPFNAFAGTTVLVTGGAGLVGSTLADALIAAGARVRILDNLSTGNPEIVNSEAELLVGDVSDPDAVARAMAGVAVVFHQAAQINPVKAVEDPTYDCRVNVLGSVIMLKTAAEAGVRRVVLASTNLYGNRPIPSTGIAEDTAVLTDERCLLSPYAAAKAAAEAYAKVFHDEYGLDTVRLRYTNVYGPRQLTKSESGVIALFAERALAGRPLEIFGQGEQTRDFVEVTDVVDANLRAAVTEAAAGRVFNIGTGCETSILDLAQHILKAARSSSSVIHKAVRAADFQRVVVDTTLAQRILGWRARTPLETGLKRYIDWLSSQPGFNGARMASASTLAP